MTEEKKKCKGGRKRGFALFVLLAMLAMPSLVLGQNYTNTISATNTEPQSLQKIAYRLQILETNIAALAAGAGPTNVLSVTNVTLGQLISLQNAISNYTFALSNISYGVSNMMGLTFNTNGYPIAQYQWNTRMAIASTNTPTAQTNGASVPLWANEYGQLILAAFTQALNALNVNPIYDSLTSMQGGDGAWIPLSSATNTQSSVWYDVSRYKYFSYFISPGAATNHWIYCEASPNSGTNWVRIYTNAVTATNNICVSIGPVAHKYMRWSYEGTNEASTVNVVAKP